nr:reverse transcriptase family protein [Enterobacter bugandensis]
MVSWSILSTAIGISPHFINSLIRNKNKYYRAFTIAKGKGKGKRVIEAPKVSIKLIQAWLAFHLSNNDNLKLCDAVHGFIPGQHGIYEAAKKHCGCDWVLSIDLKDFFHSISYRRVVNAFEQLGYTVAQAEKIAEITTYNTHLPQGAPSSPVISNLVFNDTDDAIVRFLDGKEICYTRYADDLTFSGSDVRYDIEKLKTDLLQLISNCGWVVANEKTHIAKAPNRLKVHGFLVHAEIPRLTKGYRNKIRAYNHLINSGKVDAEDLDVIRGHVNYGKFIDKLNGEH